MFSPWNNILSFLFLQASGVWGVVSGAGKSCHQIAVISFPRSASGGIAQGMQVAQTLSWDILPSPVITLGILLPISLYFNSIWNSVFQGWESDGPPAVLDVMAQSTSIQRIQRLIDSVPLTNLLLTLLSTSYRKVGAGTELENFWSWATPDCHHLRNWGGCAENIQFFFQKSSARAFLFPVNLINLC